MTTHATALCNSDTTPLPEDIKLDLTKAILEIIDYEYILVADRRKAIMAVLDKIKVPLKPKTKPTALAAEIALIQAASDKMDYENNRKRCCEIVDDVVDELYWVGPQIVTIFSDGTINEREPSWDTLRIPTGLLKFPCTSGEPGVSYSYVSALLVPHLQKLIRKALSKRP